MYLTVIYINDRTTRLINQGDSLSLDKQGTSSQIELRTSGHCDDRLKLEEDTSAQSLHSD